MEEKELFALVKALFKKTHWPTARAEFTEGQLSDDGDVFIFKRDKKVVIEWRLPDGVKEQIKKLKRNRG